MSFLLPVGFAATAGICGATAVTLSHYPRRDSHSKAALVAAYLFQTFAQGSTETFEDFIPITATCWCIGAGALLTDRIWPWLPR